MPRETRELGMKDGAKLNQRKWFSKEEQNSILHGSSVEPCNIVLRGVRIMESQGKKAVKPMRPITNTSSVATFGG